MSFLHFTWLGTDYLLVRVTAAGLIVSAVILGLLLVGAYRLGYLAAETAGSEEILPRRGSGPSL